MLGQMFTNCNSIFIPPPFSTQLCASRGSDLYGQHQHDPLPSGFWLLCLTGGTSRRQENRGVFNEDIHSRGSFLPCWCRLASSFYQRQPFHRASLSSSSSQPHPLLFGPGQGNSALTSPAVRSFHSPVLVSPTLPQPL